MDKILLRRKQLLSLSILILLFLIFSKTVHASCVMSFTNKSNLVIAKIENQQCENGNITNYFKSLLVVKGKVDKEFKIITFDLSKKCLTQVQSGEVYMAPAGCPETPKFEINKVYIMSVNPRANFSDYILPCCDRIFSEVKGVFDPRVLFYTLKVYLKPIWLSVLLAVEVLFITLFNLLEKILSSNNARALAITATIILVLSIIYLIYRGLRYIFKILKTKLKK